MQVDSPDRIRNVALTGHSDTGKTTLASALLYAGGVVNRLNKVEDGNTITDFDSEEIDRGISIGLATCFTPWQQHKVNLLDCPGYGIFFDETRSAMRAADAAMLCINAASGVEVTSEKVWEFAEEIGLPVMLHLTKMDRERAELKSAVEAMRKAFGREVIPVQVPIGVSQDFEGVVDLIEDRTLLYETMIRNIYGLGFVLRKKFKLLQKAYTSFMIALILGVGSFIAVFIWIMMQAP